MEELDKLSDLPTGVKQQILSCLPIKEAVRTSLLSTHWRYKWMRLQCLVFDDESCRATNFPVQHAVDHVLLFQTGPIQIFKLSTRRSVPFSAIDKWITYLLRKKIKHLVLRLCHWSGYNVNSSLLFYEHLTVLELHHCVLKAPTTAFKGLRLLKVLHLWNVRVSDYLLEKLFACCPLLYRVNLCHVRGITADVTIIDAPRIRFLTIQGSYFNEVLLSNNTINLVEVSIGWKQGSVISSAKLLRFLFKLPGIERLTLDDIFLQRAIESLSKKLPEPCLCLKFLSISVRLNHLKEVSAAMSLISISPALQELHILIRQEDNNGEATSCLSVNQKYAFTELRRVKVIGFNGGKAQVVFINFLLSTSPGLQELEISFGENVGRVDFSWMDDEQKSCGFEQLRVVKVTGFSGLKAEVDFIRILVSSTSPTLERMILQPASAKVSWQLLKLFSEFKSDPIQADLELLDPSSADSSSPPSPVRDSSEDDSDSDDE